jgi:hypothetical protein
MDIIIFFVCLYLFIVGFFYFFNHITKGKLFEEALKSINEHVDSLNESEKK